MYVHISTDVTYYCSSRVDRGPARSLFLVHASGQKCVEVGGNLREMVEFVGNVAETFLLARRNRARLRYYNFTSQVREKEKKRRETCDFVISNDKKKRRKRV